MPRDIPLLILDEIVLPTAETEVGLSSDEADVLSRTLEAGGLAALVARPPGSHSPTRLERKADPTSPGAIMRTCVMGSAAVLPPNASDDSHRLYLADITRGRLADVRPAPHSELVWRADVEAFPLDGELPSDDDLDDLKQRFLAVLLATRDPDAPGTTVRQQLGRPLRELSEAQGLTQLWLLADYIFDRAETRVALLQARQPAFIIETVGAALEGAGGGLSRERLAYPFMTTIAATSGDIVDAMEDLGHILAALSPLVIEDRPELSAEASRLADAATALSDDIDRLVTKLAKATSRKNR